MESGKEKPKSSIPLKKIVSVAEFTEEDQKKYKKLAKAHDLGIKVRNIKLFNCFRLCSRRSML